MADGNNPCYKCADRQVACHAECNRYLSWKAQHEKERKRIRELRQRDSEASATLLRGLVGVSGTRTRR